MKFLRDKIWPGARTTSRMAASATAERGWRFNVADVLVLNTVQFEARWMQWDPHNVEIGDRGRAIPRRWLLVRCVEHVCDARVAHIQTDSV